MSETRTRAIATRGEVVPALPAPDPARAIVPPLVSRELMRAADAIDETAQSYVAALNAARGPMSRAVLMADAIKALRAAITPEVMGSVMALMNTPNGFKTDRPSKHQPQPYDASVVKEAFITSLIEGFRPVGNEWNIIAGQFFGALNGWRRKFHEVPNISDVSVVPGAPVLVDGNWRVRVAISWKIVGVANRLADPEGKPGQVFLVPAGNGPSSADAILGKALRRAYRAAYLKATGSACTDDDLGSEPTLAAALPAPSAPTRVEQLTQRLTPASMPEARPGAASVPVPDDDPDPERAAIENEPELT